MAPRTARWLVALVLALLVSLSAAPPAHATIDSLSPGGLIVVKADATSGTTIDTLIKKLAAIRVTVVKQEALLEGKGLWVVRTKSSVSLTATLLRLNGADWAEAYDPVELAQRRFHGWPQGQPGNASPTGSDFANQPMNAWLGLDSVHARSTGRGVKVAVLDTGADLTHPALHGKATAVYDYVDDEPGKAPDGVPTGAGPPGASSVAGHGTFVAGLIAAVAPEADLRIYRVLDGDGVGNYYAIAQAVTDATDDGANVINLSFGMGQLPDSEVLHRAIDRADDLGVLVVAAAGNTGSSKAEYPAADSNALGVGALDTQRTALATFSGYGSWTDIAAPGEEVIGPLPGGRYAVWAGTSMATSIVTGQAALLVQVKPKPKEGALYSAIVGSAAEVRGAREFRSIRIAASLDRISGRRLIG